MYGMKWKESGEPDEKYKWNRGGVYNELIRYDDINEAYRDLERRNTLYSCNDRYVDVIQDNEK